MICFSAIAFLRTCSPFILRFISSKQHSMFCACINSNWWPSLQASFCFPIISYPIVFQRIYLRKRTGMPFP